MKRWVKPVLVVVGFGLLIGLMRVLPLREWLDPVFTYVEEAGRWGMALFVGLGILMTALFVPVSFVITSAGLLFGVGMGFLLSSLILIGGTSIGFFAGRFLWPRIRHWNMFQGRIFQAVREAIESEGLKLIAFLRMTPFFHFMTGNLFFGSLKLNYVPYMVFSYLGMIPGTLLVAYAGSVAGETAREGGDVGLWQGVLFGVGVLVFSLISWRVTHTTRKILHAEENETDTDTAR